MWAIVTYGQDRVWAVLEHSTATAAEGQKVYLHELQEQGDPVQILSLDPNEYQKNRTILQAVKEDRRRFRVRNGIIEERPTSQVDIVSGEVAISGSLLLQAAYSAEAPGEHFIEVNKEAYSASATGQMILDLNEPGRYELSVKSGPHYQFVRVINVEEGN